MAFPIADRITSATLIMAPLSHPSNLGSTLEGQASGQITHG